MPARVKSLENQSKHLTKLEQQVRAQAEAELSRPGARLKPPAGLRGDKAAEKYWRAILKRMEDVELLDDLDSETLGIHCSMLSRRDAMDGLYRQLIAQSAGEGVGAERRLAAQAAGEAGEDEELFGDG